MRAKLPVASYEVVTLRPPVPQGAPDATTTATSTQAPLEPVHSEPTLTLDAPAAAAQRSPDPVAEAVCESPPPPPEMDDVPLDEQFFDMTALPPLPQLGVSVPANSPAETTADECAPELLLLPPVQVVGETSDSTLPAAPPAPPLDLAKLPLAEGSRVFIGSGFKSLRPCSCVRTELAQQCCGPRHGSCAKWWSRTGAHDRRRNRQSAQRPCPHHPHARRFSRPSASALSSAAP